jgi:hypothetical protein
MWQFGWPEGVGLKFIKVVEVPPYHYGAVFQRSDT